MIGSSDWFLQRASVSVLLTLWSQKHINSSCREMGLSQGKQTPLPPGCLKKLGVPSAARCAFWDLPMHLCLSHNPFLQQHLQSCQVVLQPGPSSIRSCLARPPQPLRPKKQVVFADTKGLSLTSMRRFENATAETEEAPCPTSSFPGSAPSCPAEPTTSLWAFPHRGRTTQVS